MLFEVLDKQRRAVQVVKTALLGLGMRGRAVCVTADSDGASRTYAVFISSGIGEPFFETGGSIAEAVRNTLNALKGKHGAKSVDQTDLAPF